MIAELLDELAHSIPALPGAACRADPQLFDVDRDDPRAEAAMAICRTCPCLNRCRRWLRSQPRALRPCGVVAGRYVAPPRLPPEPRPRTSPSRDRATDWLRDYMALHGPVISTEVIADATAVGISHTALFKARHDLGVRLQRVPGVGARHTWT